MFFCTIQTLTSTHRSNLSRAQHSHTHTTHAQTHTHAHYTTLHTHFQKCLALPPQDLDSHTLVSPQVARRCSGGASRIGDQNFPLSHWTIGTCCCATAFSLSLSFPRSQSVVSAALTPAQSASLAATSSARRRRSRRPQHFCLLPKQSGSLICRGGG